MYTIKKRLEISGAHKLTLDYGSKCENLHGHNWIIIITCQAQELDHNGMVYDFTHIKKKIADVLDHANLNDILPFNPTAENIARWIAQNIGEKCIEVTVQESEGNIAIYEV